MVTIIDRDFEEDASEDSPEIMKEKAHEIANMYDDSAPPGENGLYGMELNEGLTANETKLAALYASLATGMAVVDGAPGSGKGVFTNHLIFRLRRLFKGRKVLLDYKPRSLFDLGTPNNRYVYFDSEFLNNEIGKMAEVSKVKIVDKDGGIETGKKITKKQALNNTKALAKNWAEDKEMWLLNAIMALDEFKKYFHNRNPMNPTGITIGHIIAIWRHLGLLILGMCPYIHEIDQYSVIPYMSHHVRCSSAFDGRTFFADYYRKKQVTSKGVINAEGRPVRIKVDGSKPLPEIGVELLGSNYPECDFGNKERAIVDYLKVERNHIANINMINKYVDEDIDTLNSRLLFLHDLGIVECKSFFDIFNSKNVSSPKIN